MTIEELNQKRDEHADKITKLEKDNEAYKHVNSCLMAEITNLKKRNGWLESGFIHTCHDDCQRPLCLANREIDKLKLENAELKELRIMNLAGISTASFQNTRESTKERITKDNPYWTAAYDDVCRTVDREINLRESLDVAHEALAKIKDVR